MSIRVMSRVWDESEQKGSALLLLLAIADYAHDDGGGAYPGVDTLAKKTRLSVRQTQRVIQQLADSGELEIQRSAGPRGVNIDLGSGVWAHFN